MNRSRGLRLLERSSSAILLLGGGAFIVVYVTVAMIRLSYPFELEWMEGGSVVHVQRVLDGQPLYGRPSIEFTPFIYAPFYYYASAVPALALGNGFLALRLISFTASIGSFFIIALLVYKRTGSAYASCLGSCLFAAAFKLTGAWFDLARVDSLALFLVLAGAYLLEGRPAFVKTVGAAALLFLSFFTKQSSAVVVASLAVAILVTGRGRDRIILPAGLSLLIVGSVLVMNALTDGWYSYYIFDVPARHPVETRMMTEFWTRDLGTHLPIALAFCMFALFQVGTEPRDRLLTTRDVGLFGGLVLASYFSRIHSGGFDNVLMPAAAGIAIFFGMGFAAARQASTQRPALTIAIVAAAGIQFVMLVYSPRYQIPTSTARRQGEHVRERVEAIRGDVYFPDHPWYAVAAGKPSQAQTMGMGDLIRADGSEAIRVSLEEAMRVAVDQERYAAFVMDEENFLFRPVDFERHYQLVDARLSDEEFLPLTGMRRAPKLMFVRRQGVN